MARDEPSNYHKPVSSIVEASIMSENQEKMTAYNEAVTVGASASSRAERPANSTERVISAFTTAACGGAGPRQSAFEIAVGVCLDEYPETDPAAAARIVADIIAHRS